MAFKGSDPCHEKAAPDEPIFTLRAKDRLAPGMVEQWAMSARAVGCPEAKVQEALACAQAMREWQAKNGSKNPD